MEAGEQNMNIVSFDVGGTAVKQAVFDEQGKILHKSSFPTPESKDAFLNSISNSVADLEETGEIRALTFSFPGYINPDTGYAETSGAIQYFYNQNIAQVIEAELNYPVYIENDANCAALAEKISGNAQEVKNFFVVTVGTGIGGAIYINNNLYRGFQFKAGEYGRMRINYSLAPEKTLHDFSSVRILISGYKERKGLDIDTNITAEMILEEARSDSETRILVESWIDTICTGIFNVATVLNPEKILIGGGISINPYFISLVRERMNGIFDWSEFAAPIEPCRYYNDAGIIGAYYMAVEKIAQQKAAYLDSTSLN